MKRAARALLVVLVELLAVSLTWSSGRGEAAKLGGKVKDTISMGNSGVPQPAGVDPSSNWAINIIEKYANVDLELEIPNYQDFATKCNLPLASGNLPDVIHSWIKADMVKAADAGAFLDLEAFWDRSPQAQKVVPALNMEPVKDETITGEMSLDDWDAAVKDWKQKYGFMLDTQNKWMNDNKAVLATKGVKIHNQ